LTRLTVKTGDLAPVFDSEIQRLDWLIRQVEKCVKGRDEPQVAPELVEVFVVTSTWLNTALAESKAILLLVMQGLAEAVGPLQRALWELWIEWRYCLRHGDRSLNAAKVILNAMLEALEPFEGQAGVFEASVLARLKGSAQEFEAQHARAAVELRAQRQKRRYHWSGLSRSEMERTLGGNPLIYRMLSWDAHAVVSVIRDASFELTDTVARFHFGREASQSDANWLAFANGGVLFYIYNDFAQLWGLPPVVLPHA
jgi:hypothetical protein